jgi:hypothetical protein
VSGEAKRGDALDCGGLTARGAPQLSQNLLPTSALAPQLEHTAPNVAPHSRQNRAPSRFSAWHRGHRMPGASIGQSHIGLRRKTSGPTLAGTSPGGQGSFVGSSTQLGSGRIPAAARATLLRDRERWIRRNGWKTAARQASRQVTDPAPTTRCRVRAARTMLALWFDSERAVAALAASE